jgi:hypothetical protein
MPSLLCILPTNITGYDGHVYTLALYRDMSARELTARRSTDAKGDTTWAASPLVEAALAGGLLVLDGVGRYCLCCVVLYYVLLCCVELWCVVLSLCFFVCFVAVCSVSSTDVKRWHKFGGQTSLQCLYYSHRYA